MTALIAVAAWFVAASLLACLLGRFIWHGNGQQGDPHREEHRRGR
jgi:hypothetical protein